MLILGYFYYSIFIFDRIYCYKHNNNNKKKRLVFKTKQKKIEYLCEKPGYHHHDSIQSSLLDM